MASSSSDQQPDECYKAAFKTILGHAPASTDSEGSKRQNEAFGEPPAKRFKIDHPMPTFEPTEMLTLIADIKTKLGELDAAMYRENGDEMSQSLDRFLDNLESADLLVALESIQALSDILNPKKDLFALYTPYIQVRADRLLSAVTKQLRFFWTTYWNPAEVPAEVFRNRQSNKKKAENLYQFVSSISCLMEQILKCPLGTSSPDKYDFSHEALTEFVHAILPFMVYDHVKGHHRVFYSIEDAFCRYSLPEKKKKNISRQTKMLAVQLRILCDLLAKTQTCTDPETVLQLNHTIDALNVWIERELELYVGRYSLVAKLSDDFKLDQIFGEIYALFEQYAKLVSFNPTCNAQPLELAKLIIKKSFAEPGVDAWKHFDLVDAKIREANLKTEDTALFRYLTSRGFIRPEASEAPKQDPVEQGPDVEPLSAAVDASVDDQSGVQDIVPEQDELAEEPSTSAPSSSTNKETVLALVHKMHQELVKSQEVLAGLVKQLANKTTKN